MGKMFHKSLTLFLILTVISHVNSQPDNRYDPFDWVLYRQLGEITSITKGFAYIYIGTESGGVVRIQRIGHNLEEPLTTAQGLKSNFISAVHFDRHTGTLWITADDYIHSSHTREGNWYINNIDEWGLPLRTKITRLGSSQNYIWVQTSSGYIKLDHISGIFLGTYTFPDEEYIHWSSSSQFPNFETDKVNEYSMSDGWLAVGSGAVSPNGRNLRVTVFYEGSEGDVVLGLADGTIFVGDNRLKFLEPLTAGLGNNDVQFMLDKKAFIIGGRFAKQTIGFTYFDPRREIMEIIGYDDHINLTAGPYYCAVRAGDEIWYGWNSMIAVYDEKDDFWRTLDETRGFSGQIITDMEADSEFVWIASSSGLTRINQSSKRSNPIGFEKIFNHIFIYDIELVDNQLWIASDYDLTVVNLSNERVLNFKQIGSLGNMAGIEDVLSGFKVLEQFKDEIIVSSKQGVWSFDYNTQTWSELVDASVFAGREIFALARFKKYIFLATNDGFIRYDIKDRFIRDYHYEFLGQIHDMKVDKKHLWLGTSNGLLKFKWTKD